MTQLAHAGADGMAASPFAHDRYTIKRNYWTLFGRDFQVSDPNGTPCMHVRHKLFTLRGEWNIFTDSSQRAALVRLKAREAIGLNFTTDVFDAQTGACVGTVRLKGLKSIVRDAWEVLDAGGNVIGALAEDSNGLLRRLLPTFFGMPLILGHWILTVGGTPVMEVTEARTFFVKTFVVTIAPGAVDRRFAIGCALLALMRELIRESPDT